MRKYAGLFFRHPEQVAEIELKLAESATTVKQDPCFAFLTLEWMTELPFRFLRQLAEASVEDYYYKFKNVMAFFKKKDSKAKIPTGGLLLQTLNEVYNFKKNSEQDVEEYKKRLKTLVNNLKFFLVTIQLKICRMY